MELVDIYKSGEVYNIIQKDIASNMVNHAYLLNSDDVDLVNETANLVAMQLLCDDDICGVCPNCLKIKHHTHLDVRTYPEDENKQILTEDVLKIIQESYITKSEKYKIFILKNFDKVLPQAQNKFLKTLEEPPQNVVYLLLTTDEKSVLKTIVSRCKQINIPSIKVNQLESLFEIKDIPNNLTVKQFAEISKSLTVANKLLHSPYYFELKQDVAKVFTTLKHSKNMLGYVAKLSGYKNSLEVLSEMNNIVLDLANIKNGNKVESYFYDDLKEVSDEYSLVALNKIAHMIKKSVEKINMYCNTNLVFDALIMYILEVKTKC